MATVRKPPSFNSRNTRETGGSNTGTSSNFGQAYGMPQDRLVDLQRRIAYMQQNQRMVNPLPYVRTGFRPTQRMTDPLPYAETQFRPTQRMPNPQQTNSWDYENLPESSYHPAPLPYAAQPYVPTIPYVPVNQPTNSWDYENLPPTSYSPPPAKFKPPKKKAKTPPKKFGPTPF